MCMCTYLTKQKLPLTTFHQQREINIPHYHDDPKNIGFWIARVWWRLYSCIQDTLSGDTFVTTFSF